MWRKLSFTGKPQEDERASKEGSPPATGVSPSGSEATSAASPAQLGEDLASPKPPASQDQLSPKDAEQSRADVSQSADSIRSPSIASPSSIAPGTPQDSAGRVNISGSVLPRISSSVYSPDSSSDRNVSAPGSSFNGGGSMNASALSVEQGKSSVSESPNLGGTSNSQSSNTADAGSMSNLYKSPASDSNDSTQTPTLSTARATGLQPTPIRGNMIVKSVPKVVSNLQDSKGENAAVQFIEGEKSFAIASNDTALGKSEILSDKIRGPGSVHASDSVQGDSNGDRQRDTNSTPTSGTQNPNLDINKFPPNEPSVESLTPSNDGSQNIAADSSTSLPTVHAAESAPQTNGKLEQDGEDGGERSEFRTVNFVYGLPLVKCVQRSYGRVRANPVTGCAFRVAEVATAPVVFVASLLVALFNAPLHLADTIISEGAKGIMRAFSCVPRVEQICCGTQICDCDIPIVFKGTETCVDDKMKQQ